MGQPSRLPDEAASFCGAAVPAATRHARRVPHKRAPGALWGSRPGCQTRRLRFVGRPSRLPCGGETRTPRPRALWGSRPGCQVREHYCPDVIGTGTGSAVDTSPVHSGLTVAVGPSGGSMVNPVPPHSGLT